MQKAAGILRAMKAKGMALDVPSELILLKESLRSP